MKKEIVEDFMVKILSPLDINISIENNRYVVRILNECRVVYNPNTFSPICKFIGDNTVIEFDFFDMYENVNNFIPSQIHNIDIMAKNPSDNSKGYKLLYNPYNDIHHQSF